MILQLNTSIFELLRNGAGASFIVQAAFSYFGLTFLTGCVLGYFRQVHLVGAHHMTQATATLIELPIMVLASLLWARWVVARYRLPATAGLRAVVGLLALGFMLATESLGVVLMHGKGLRRWIWEGDRVAGSAFAVSLVLFGLMPWFHMLVDKEANQRLEKGID